MRSSLFYFIELFLYVKGVYGDITSRKMLRQKLQCQSFEWYLKDIYPELFIPSHALASSDVRKIRFVPYLKFNFSLLRFEMLLQNFA